MVLICMTKHDLVSVSDLPFLLVRYVDAVLTIPKGTLFPLCGMNLAFDRELIGPAMYFGLMGDGQPIGRYDDMWAGWCTKVFHLLFVLFNNASAYCCHFNFIII